MNLSFCTPLIPLQSHPSILLKLENLQPYSSYKIRGVCHALNLAPKDSLRKGVAVASAGNMAQAVGYVARKLGIPATAYVPNTAPEIKKQRIRELGVNLIELPFDKVWELVRDPSQIEFPGYFLHPAFDANLREGYGTLVDELLADDKTLSAVLVPFGVGGLSLGIAEAIKKRNAKLKLIAVEVETAAPLKLSLKEKKASAVARQPSFVDAIGTPEVLPEIYEQLEPLLEDVIVVSVEEVKFALKEIYFSHRIIVEGAGAASVAAALKLSSSRKVASIVTGGNIDQNILSELL